MLGNTNSASGLSLRVVGGTTEPSGAKNLIWVNTAVDINNWYICYEEPEEPAAGDVWIHVADQLGTDVELVKTESQSIIIRPYLAQQYISNAWVTKVGKIYDGSAWQDLQQIPTEDLVAFWSFDDPLDSTTTIHDQIGTNNLITTTPDRFDLPSGKVGKCLHQGSNAEYHYTSTAKAGQACGPVTFSLWLRTYTSGDFSQAARIIFKTCNTGASDNIGYQLLRTNINKIKFIGRDSSGENFSVTTSATVFSEQNIWHHVVAQWDGTDDNNGVKIYIDNTPSEASSATRDGGAVTDPSLNVTLFNDGYEVGTDIDQFRIYNKFLSAEEISKLYNSGNGV